MVNGTLVWYYSICKRQVWLIGHGIAPDQGDENISLGRYLHSFYFKRENLKEIMVDNTIKVDLIRGRRIITEIKKSSKYLESARNQLIFYLYYLKKYKNLDLEGEILIPEERKRIVVRLSDKDIENIEGIIKDINEILNMDIPPEPQRIKYCRKCGYKDMCWV